MAHESAQTIKPRRRAQCAARHNRTSISKPVRPLAPHARYEIIVKGQLDVRWSAWFDRLPVTPENGTTIIKGIVDQPKLRGILNKLWDLNLTLISVNRIAK